MKLIEKNNQCQPLALKTKYIALAVKLDYCVSKEESETILLEENSYQLAYNTPKNNTLINGSLFYFIRSRIAFFQQDFIWFQKETLNLINFWLSKEPEVTYYINELTNKELLNILTFNSSAKSTGFPSIWVRKEKNDGNSSNLNAATSLLFHQVKKDKIAVIDMKI
jgi:hypothetical protein